VEKNKIDSPTLIIFSGLPGVGKTTLAKAAAKEIGAAYLRIDTVEQTLRDLCDVQVEYEGYQLVHRIASENLKLGLSVVADSCNPLALTRDDWNQVAKQNGAHCINIEVICGDKEEHRRRVETRCSDVAGLMLPNWREVEGREYHEWASPRVVIDTSKITVRQSVKKLLTALNIGYENIDE